MSAFLGPVHVKMYNRVLYQDAMGDAILGLAEARGWASGLRDRVKAAFPAASTAPLETIIDGSNIHGWLSEAVERCERRFTAIAEAVLTEDPSRLCELQDEMKKMGQQNALDTHSGAEHAYGIIHDILLDGMPCDFPFIVTDSGPDVVEWQVKNCPHAPFWVSGTDAYYKLRDAWVEGALYGSGLSHERSGDKHFIRKAG